jgi:hypothetical protein
VAPIEEGTMSEARLAASTDTKNALTILTDDHQRILDLLLQFRDAGDAVARKGIVDNVVAELETHSLLAEEVALPAVRRLAVDESIVDLAEAGNREAERIAEDLADANPDDERFDTLFNQLTEQITQHIRHEEGEIFACLRTLGDEELVELGKKLRERKEAALTELHEHGPEAPVSIAGAS